MRFSQGVNFTFPVGTTLAANATVLIVHNTAAFTARYGSGKPVAGAWLAGNKLSNGGDQLNIKYGDALTPFYTMTYDDVAPWPLTPDGNGPSLVLLAPQTNPNASSQSPLPTSSSVGGYLTLTFPRLEDPADLTYSVEFTDSLATPFAAGGTGNDVTVRAVPEPGTPLLLLTALALLLRRKAHSR